MGEFGFLILQQTFCVQPRVGCQKNARNPSFEHIYFSQHYAHSPMIFINDIVILQTSNHVDVLRDIRTFLQSNSLRRHSRSCVSVMFALSSGRIRNHSFAPPLTMLARRHNQQSIFQHTPTTFHPIAQSFLSILFHHVHVRTRYFNQILHHGR